MVQIPSRMPQNRTQTAAVSNLVISDYISSCSRSLGGGHGTVHSARGSGGACLPSCGSTAVTDVLSPTAEVPGGAPWSSGSADPTTTAVFPDLKASRGATLKPAYPLCCVSTTPGPFPSVPAPGASESAQA
ncbi:hypothetical protein GH733_016059 [Mirounga leonina]|nr:hypothetical protein GH733_016059 [Mirounga leonina]